MALPTKRYTLGSRMLGLLFDLILLVVFLLFSVTLLNILITTVVLVVGLAQSPDPLYDDMPESILAELHEVVPDDSGRLKEDALDFGIAIAAAVVMFFIYRGTLAIRRRKMHVFGAGSFEIFVSKRYLVAREGGRLVGLITIVSVLGVSVGVMALIVVISVMQGFDANLMQKFMGVYSHVDLVPHPQRVQDPLIPEDVAEKVIAGLETLDFVEGAAPVYDKETVVQKELSAKGGYQFALIRGIDPARERNVTEFQNYVIGGSADPAFKEVVLGETMANKLRVVIGDEIYLMGQVTPLATRTGIKRLPVKVVGIFRSGLYDVDDKFIFTDLRTIQELMLTPDKVLRIHVKIKDPYHVQDYVPAMFEFVPNTWGYLTWQRANPDFLEALWVEKVAMFIILLLIVLVAALNIIGTLIMTVVQKTRDIGVLKSMGAGNGMIMRIFLYHGFLIGFVGTSLGVAWGLRLCLFVKYDIQKIFQLPGGVYGMDRLPVIIDPVLIAFMAFCAMAICMIASIIPAFQASRLDPVEALRHE